MRQLVMSFSLILAIFASTGPVKAETAQGNGQGSFDNVQNFDQAKQRVEQRLQSVISKMQEHLSCVENAQDPQTLRACLPNRGMRRHTSFDKAQPGG